MGIELPDDLVPDGRDDYEVTPDAWPAVSMFLKVQTQWRVGMGAVIGLDYGALRWCFELEEVDNPRELLEDLQVIEGRVVEILSQRDG
ncbi:phage protein [Synechococcus phage S-CBS1]|uniref:tail length tape measure protein n=1 Tax=Synechococcus phage S-CBS1 TaxID=909297 RepID=UPI000231E28A|nr:tail length tape measure protein [Synechococcus phage S-CBS1]ADP06619.1 phage protein [Synechococcus phage S-CBS1]